MFFVRHRGEELQVDITGLPPASETAFRICAVNPSGDSPFSRPIIASTSAGRPSPPRNLHLDGASSSRRAKISWTPPRALGGLPLEEYRVYAHGVLVDSVPAGRTHYVFGRLPPGSDVSASVSALTNGGESDPTDPPLTFVTPPDIPSQPLTPLCVSHTHNEAVLSWSAPADNGAKISHYALLVTTLEGEPVLSQDRIKARTTSWTLRALSPRTSYKATLTASNVAGTSNPSPPLTWTTSAPPPGLPPTPVGPPGIAGITLTDVHTRWAPLPPQAQDPRAPLLAYVLYAQKHTLAAPLPGPESAPTSPESDPSSFVAYVGSAPSAFLRDQDPTFALRFALALRNRVGQTPLSPWTPWTTLSPRPPFPPPSPPAILGGGPSQDALTLSVTLPDFDGLAPFVGYEIVAKLVFAPSMTGSDDPNAFHTLANGCVLPRSGWAIAGRSPVPPGTLGGTTLPPATISGFEPGMVIRACAIVYNAVGPSSRSPPILVTFPGLPPSPPTAPRLANMSSVTSTSIKLKWGAPALDYGSPVFQYIVYGAPDSFNEGEPLPVVGKTVDGRSLLISDLEPGTRYRFAVAAVSAEGESSLSPPLNIVTLPKSVLTPYTPTVLSPPDESGSFTVAWDEGSHMSKARARKLAKARNDPSILPTTSYQVFADDSRAKDNTGLALLYQGPECVYSGTLPRGQTWGTRIAVRALHSPSDLASDSTSSRQQNENDEHSSQSVSTLSDFVLVKGAISYAFDLGDPKVVDDDEIILSDTDDEDDRDDDHSSSRKGRQSKSKKKNNNNDNDDDSSTSRRRSRRFFSLSRTQTLGAMGAFFALVLSLILYAYTRQPPQ